SNLEFANFVKFNLSGHKFTDVSGNDTTVTNADDTALSRSEERRVGKDNSTLDAGEQYKTTGTDGAWSFTGLGTSLVGKKVFEIMPTGDVETLYSVDYGSAGTNQTSLNFANFVKFNLSGHKFTDVSGNDTTATNADDTALS